APDLKPFGGSTGVALSGSGAVTNGAVTYSATATVTNLTLVPSALVINNATLTLNQAGITAAATATVGPSGHSTTVTLAGRYVDASDWSLTTTAAGGTGPGLPGGATTASFRGTVADTGGSLQYDLLGTVSGTLSAGPFSTTGTLAA